LTRCWVVISWINLMVFDKVIFDEAINPQLSVKNSLANRFSTMVLETLGSALEFTYRAQINMKCNLNWCCLKALLKRVLPNIFFSLREFLRVNSFDKRVLQSQRIAELFNYLLCHWQNEIYWSYKITKLYHKLLRMGYKFLSYFYLCCLSS
jgi:hypothetical protein